ncbi:MAG: GNAT family N-acetyltransferase [Candidatus Buchananbacteria bacterium RIFCSPHIGHO2_01_FULL_39_14]|uniref:GNAT family N-acetyltransferase n=1 Tax=Candidatus Buchananbacteria bacterium RIFCSPHIGHO2_01_FULL_39_14 TaxID=1797532 RepID=A0A1G1XUF9_9BACT|nr:MAG: GNAT family N-acetyltransferase [Candidatus Buchananbacteria bacterium RIFCSPHIGHO2_01_FULL_39_14]
MHIHQKPIQTNSLKFFIVDQANNKEIARVFLYLLHNDLHIEPFGFIEDLYVEESHRGQGLGTQLINHVIAQAKENKCYKLICTSRHARELIHKMYEKHGFKNYGLEFRMDFVNE